MVRCILLSGAREAQTCTIKHHTMPRIVGDETGHSGADEATLGIVVAEHLARSARYIVPLPTGVDMTISERDEFVSIVRDLIFCDEGFIQAPFLCRREPYWLFPNGRANVFGMLSEYSISLR